VRHWRNCKNNPVRSDQRTGTQCPSDRDLTRRHGFIIIILTRRLQGFGAPVALVATDADFGGRVYQSDLRRLAADGKAYIFGEAVDDPIGLGERCAALEGQVLPQSLRLINQRKTQQTEKSFSMMMGVTSRRAYLDHCIAHPPGHRGLDPS
jgi:hypothetical protein